MAGAGQVVIQAEKRLLDLPPLPEVPAKAFESFVVVMTVHNRPDMAIPCLESFERNTPAAVRILIVDDASDAYTVNTLHQWCLKANEAHPGRATLVTNDTNLRYTRTINRGFNRAFDKMGATWACALNSDVLLPPGWAHRMLRCAMSDTSIQMISPWILNDGGALTILPVAGAGYEEADERVRALIPNPNFPRAITPVGALMAVHKDIWKTIGPFDVELSPHGYGEEVDFWAKMEREGFGRSAICDDLLIYHAAHQSFGAETKKLLAETSEKLHNKYGEYFRRMGIENPAMAEIRDFLNTNLPNVEINGSKRKQVAFYITGIQLCGGVLTLVNICNRLNQRGMNATIAFERDDFGDWARFTPNFGPIRLKNHDTPGWKQSGGFEQGVLYATAFFTGDYVKRIEHAHPGIETAAFIQDREDYFRNPDGSLQYTTRAKYEDIIVLAQKRLSVVNSNWVMESLEKELKCVVPNYIPIGVDPNLFYNRGNRTNLGDGGPLRILTFCRPTTPRRGYDTLDFVYKELKKKYGTMVELLTYDQRPEIGVGDKHIGKLPQTKLAEWMSASHILLETSSVQGWGMPAQEMMASEGMVISYANGGISNYADRYTALIMNRDATKEDFLRAVSDVVEAPMLMTKYGPKARARVAGLSWDRVVDAWWALLGGEPT
jgi:GT2 family glycosyltransferase